MLNLQATQHVSIFVPSHTPTPAAPPLSAGNGLGSAAPRARGLSMWALSMAASFLVNGYMLSFMNRLAPLAGPPPDSGAGAGGAAGRGPGSGFVTIGQQLHPATAAAMAGVAAAAVAGEGAGGERLANGLPDQMDAVAAANGAAGALAGGGAAAGAAAARAAAPDDAPADLAAAPAPQQDAGVQAGAPGAAEPPVPAPQQRRVVGGPRLPERPARRNAAVGPDAALAPAQQPLAPPPAAPHTPQFRDQRAPTPTGDSEEAELRAAAAAAAAASPAGSEAHSAVSPAPAASSEGSGAGSEALAALAADGQELERGQQEERPHGGPEGAAAPADGGPAGL